MVCAGGVMGWYTKHEMVYEARERTSTTAIPRKELIFTSLSVLCFSSILLRKHTLLHPYYLPSACPLNPHLRHPLPQVVARKAVTSSRASGSGHAPRRHFARRQYKPAGRGGPDGWRRCLGADLSAIHCWERKVGQTSGKRTWHAEQEEG